MKKAFLVAPSTAINKTKLKTAVKTLEKLGFGSKYRDDITSMYLNHYAGTPQRRAAELNEAYKDSGTSCIFSVCGGMGAVHLLSFLDFKAIKKNKKILLGYSDNTILLNVINQKTGNRCLHGPIMNKPLKVYHEKTISSLMNAMNKEDYSVRIKDKDVFKRGFAIAPIFGGNLRLIARSLGTKYELNTKGKILFFEAVDKNERWVFDRLWQLKLAGKFNHVKGIILGNFTRCGKEIDMYLKEFFKDFKCPIIMHQPFGHEEPNLTIPLGEKCIIDTEKGYWKIKF